MDLPPTLTAVLRTRDGVVNRRQLLSLGLSKPRIETLVRRRSLTAVHRSPRLARPSDLAR